MKRLHIYLSMYELLNENKQMYHLQGIDDFLEAANPFRLNDEQCITTQFISAYDNYFTDDACDDKEAYQFILTFLDKLDNKNVLSAFQLSSEEKWLQVQEMMIS